MGMTSTATRLIKRFGQEAILQKTTGGGGTPWAPEPGETVDHPVTVAVTEYSAEERGAASIPLTDLRVFMTAGVVPTTSNDLIIGGETYYIQRVGTLGPDGTVICYELQVRR